jgi:hypothetical protein
MALLRVLSVLGLTLASFVTGAYGDPLIGEFPRLYENFMSIFESLGGRRYMEAIQNGEEVNMQQDYTALNNFFGTCLREIVGSDLGTLRPSIKTGYEKIQACTATSCGANELTFTQAVNNAAGSEFRYGFDGPANLQGTFWIKNNNPTTPRGAVLMNFAKSLDPFPLSPGAVLPADPAGINFKIRVAGDRTFAFSTDGGFDVDSALEQTIRQDLIYDYAATAGFDPLVPAPPIQNANNYFVYPTFKVPGFPCVRIKFRPCLAFGKYRACFFGCQKLYRGNPVCSHIFRSPSLFFVYISCYSLHHGHGNSRCGSRLSRF